MLSTIVDLGKETFKEWNQDKASRLAAALAYYTAFSIAPLILIITAIAGIVFGERAAQGAIFSQLEGLLGSEAAATIQTAVAASRDKESSAISAAIGLATLVWSASNVFTQLQDSLNTIWNVQAKPAGIVGSVKRRIIPMTLVLGIGFLLLVSLVLSAALAVIGQFFSDLIPGSEVLWQGVNFLISFGVITLLFAAIYKILPDAEIAWRDVWVGAAITALLFTIGKTLIGIYLGHSSVGSTYGAAGSLLVFLVWVYYSVQILFFGAEFTQVYARRRGAQIVPSEHGQPLGAETSAQQGIPQQSPQPAPGTMVAAVDSLKVSVPRSAGATHKHGMLEKLMWTGLSSGAFALAGLVARKISGTLWKVLFREPPPVEGTA